MHPNQNQALIIQNFQERNMDSPIWMLKTSKVYFWDWKIIHKSTWILTRFNLLKKSKEKLSKKFKNSEKKNYSLCNNSTNKSETSMK